MPKRKPMKPVKAWAVPSVIWPAVKPPLTEGRFFRSREEARQYARPFGQRVVRVLIQEVPSCKS